MKQLVFLSLILMPFVTSAADEAIVIGATFCMTGDTAVYGGAALNGASLAIEEANSAGGVHGQKIRLALQDTEGVPAKAVAAYRDLRLRYAIQYVLTMQSSVALAIAPLANREHVVQMDVSAFTPDYSTPDDYTFRTGVLATELIRHLAISMSQALGISRVAAVYMENEKGQGGFNVFKANFPGTIALVESFKPGETDFRAILAKVKHAHISNIWIGAHWRETGILLKQAAELGIAVRAFSDVYSVESANFLEAAQGAAEGTVYAAPAFSSDPAAGPDTFAARFAARYHEPPNFLAAQSYDGALALITAMQHCGAISPDCVKAQLFSLTFPGASGAIRFNHFGDVPEKRIVLKWVHNGAFTLFPEAKSVQD